MKNEFLNYKGFAVEPLYQKFSKSNKEVVDKFLDYVSITAGESSMKKVRLKIIHITNILDKDLNKLDLDDLREFLKILNKSSLATDTSNDMKKTLKRFLKWKYEDWNIRFKDFQDVKLKHKGTNERLSKNDLLTSEDLEKLIRFAGTLQHKALIILLFETAGRPEEIYNLKWKDINFNTKEVILRSAKTGESRTVYIDQSLNRLNLYKQEYPFENVKAEDYVFPAYTNRKKPINSQSVYTFLERLGKKINKKVYAYIFRHTRLNALRKKLSPDVYQKLAGHSMEVALEHYSHIDSDDVRGEMFGKVYDIEELKPSEKAEFEKLKKDVAHIKDQNKYFAVWIRIFTDLYSGKITQKEADLKMKALQKVIEEINERK